MEEQSKELAASLTESMDEEIVRRPLRSNEKLQAEEEEVQPKKEKKKVRFNVI